MAAVPLQGLDAALVLRVLVAADDHRPLVLPQVQDALAGLYRFQQVLLQGQVVPGIVLPGVDHK